MPIAATSVVRHLEGNVQHIRMVLNIEYIIWNTVKETREIIELIHPS